METCNICKKEILQGQGLHAWNMVTGFQAYIHETCQRQYERLGSWCRMEVHQECSGVVYFGNEELPCECECHLKKAEIIAECDDCGKELTRDDVAYHDMESDTGVWHYYCSDCAPRSYYE